MLGWVGLGANGLSSACYGPEKAYVALGVHTELGPFLALATTATVFIIAVAYSQVMEIFPSGGGSYKIASQLLGPKFGLVSGSAQVVDYVLTIAVSLASGTDALFSLLPVSAQSYKLPAEIGLTALLVVLNLRGMQESIRFLAPIFVGFVLVHALLIIFGISSDATRFIGMWDNASTDIGSLSSQAGWTFVAAVFLTLLKLPVNARPDAGDSVLADLRAGWSFARSLGWVLPVASLSLVFNAVSSGAINVLGPVIAKATVGADGWGLARSAEALGLFAFTFVLARVTIRRPLLACQYGFLAMAAPMIALAFAAQVLPLSAAFLVSGCGLCLINLAWNLTVQEKVPEAMLSRIMAIDGFFSFVAIPLGQVAIGPASAWFGTQDVQLGAAAIMLVTFLIGATRPAIRRLTLTGPQPSA